MRQINLLPESLQKKERIRAIRISVLYAVGPVTVVMILVHFLLVWKIASMREAVAHPPVQVETAEIIQLREHVAGLDKETENYLNANLALLEEGVRSYRFSSGLSIIGKIAERKVWLSYLGMNNKKRTLEMVGKSYTVRLVSEFMLELKKVPYLSNVTLITMEKGADEKIDFKISCELK